MYIDNGLHRSFSINTLGRDFVIGDIHGDFRGLKTFLRSINFDYSKDRLFCCGDLIGRGYLSYSVIHTLFNSDWFFSVFGNHEMITYLNLKKNVGRFFGFDEPLMPNESYIDDDIYNWSVKNGGRWIYGVNSDGLRVVRSAIESLPLCISIEVDGGTVGIVHANPPLDWEDLLSDCQSKTLSDFLLIANDKFADLNSYLWSRSLIASYNSGVPSSDLFVNNIDVVYCGHTVVDGILSIGNVNFIDSGAWVYKDGSYPIVQL